MLIDISIANRSNEKQNKTKIPPDHNSFKIQKNNGRNRGKMLHTVMWPLIQITQICYVALSV